MAAELRSTFEGRTMVLTISNPEHRNALGPEMYAAGVEALNVAESNADVHCVVLTGEGEAFCAGGNLQRLQANRQKPPEVQAQSIENLHSWIEAIRTFPKPVIAAVEGPAAGAGFSLALACDLIVAGEGARFAVPPARLGIGYPAADVARLSARVGRGQAARLLFTAATIDAAEALRIGLADLAGDPAAVAASTGSYGPPMAGITRRGFSPSLRMVRAVSA